MNPAVVVAGSALLCGLGGAVLPSSIARLPTPAEEDVDFSAIAEEPALRRSVLLLSLGAGALIGWRIGWQASLIFLLPLVPVGAVLAMLDWRTRLLPTRLIGPAYAVTVVGLLVAALLTGETSFLGRAGAGWLAYGGLFWCLWFVHPRGLGYGDVRLAGLLGLALGALGWAEVVTGLYGGFLLGALAGGLLMFRRGSGRRTAIPFGPFMLLAALIAVLAGEPLVRVLR